MQDSNQPTELQRLARMLKFCVEQVYQLYYPGSENKAADQTMRMCWLVCAFDVRMQLFSVFSQHAP